MKAANEVTRIFLPPCPHLPVSERTMDWRDINIFREGGDRGAAFYETALLYAQYLWQRGYAARAILCLDRAFGADVQGDEKVLEKWPLPYPAMAWVLRHVPEGIFIGNPRVHFQHYAGRMNEPRREQRRWRAWACWAIARKVMPHLAGDARHVIEEPEATQIHAMLVRHGIAGEAALWSAVMAE